MEEIYNMDGGIEPGRKPVASKEFRDILQREGWPRGAADARMHYSRVETRRRKRRASENLLIVALLMVLLTRLFVLNTSYVNGPSMMPTLYEGERVLLLKAAYAFAAPERYDVVVVQFPGEQQRFVKRIIGMPGETVELRGKEGIFIDGKKLAGDVYGHGTNPRTGTWKLDYRSYFVMGDNREHSTDSAMLGSIHRDGILGRGLMVYWPLDRIDTL